MLNNNLYFKLQLGIFIKYIGYVMVHYHFACFRAENIKEHN